MNPNMIMLPASQMPNRRKQRVLCFLWKMMNKENFWCLFFYTLKKDDCPKQRHCGMMQLRQRIQPYSDLSIFLQPFIKFFLLFCIEEIWKALLQWCLKLLLPSKEQRLFLELNIYHAFLAMSLIYMPLKSIAYSKVTLLESLMQILNLWVNNQTIVFYAYICFQYISKKKKYLERI